MVWFRRHDNCELDNTSAGGFDPLLDITGAQGVSDSSADGSAHFSVEPAQFILRQGTVEGAAQPNFERIGWVLPRDYGIDVAVDFPNPSVTQTL